MDCVFCAIAADDAPAYRVYEDEQTVAFLDAAPAASGHTLVVPRAHRETLTDADPGEVAAVFRTVRRVAAAVEDALAPGGVNLVQSSGAPAGQDVPHLHVHVVPRAPGDDVRIEWAGASPGGDEQRTTAAALRDAL